MVWLSARSDILFLAEMWEQFSYYGMRAGMLFALDRSMRKIERA